MNTTTLITTDDDFYRFNVNERIKKLSPNKQTKAKLKYSKHNFTISMQMEPDGEKLMQVRIEKLKILIKPHIYLIIYELFVSGMP